MLETGSQLTAGSIHDRYRTRDREGRGSGGAEHLCLLNIGGAKPGEPVSDSLAPVDLPVLDDGIGRVDAQERLESLGLGDGLPLVPPTARRLEAMLAGIVEPHHGVAALAPLLGMLSPAAVAYQCVLAGCRPAS